MTTLNTALQFDCNDNAKFRLRLVKLLNKTNMETVKFVFPGVSKRSVYRWRSKYLVGGKRLSSLIAKSTRPKQTRQMLIPSKVLGFIKTLRQQYPRLSKYKIKVYLDDFCQQNNLPVYSVSWIGKVISRHKFFFNVRQPIRRKTRSLRSKDRVKYCPKQKDIKLGYMQLDCVHVVFEKKNYYFICAIELKSRQAFAKRVIGLSSQQAKIFLRDIQTQTNYPVHTIQTDNGSEFEGWFDKATKQSNIKHLWSYPRSPKTNGYIERFNWTIQDEFINYKIDIATYNLNLFDKKLKTWLDFYNNKRPHQSLGYLTPYSYLLKLQQQEKQTTCAKCM